MAFYMSPPGGNISLQKLTMYAITRFNFLCKIYETGGDRIQIFDIVNDTDTVEGCECLIEGSVKDKVSHFILRLICCCDEDMTSFFIKAERLLFDFRFASMTEDELCRLFKSVDRFKKNMDVVSKYPKKACKQVPHFIRNFMNILSLIKGQKLKWRNVVKMYLNGEDGCFTVPFQTVLQFVAKRQVNLKSGLAFVPFCKLREVITSQFHEFLSGAVYQVQTVFHTEDERMLHLIKTLKVMFKQRFRRQNIQREGYRTLSHTDIDNVVHMFPPCMSHLHSTLKLTHRLKHHSRVQYSLFLKEAGLPVHEALMFWRKEYSQAPSNHAGCSHDWYKNERRYTYNIRHLYGLEGSRINYRGHSCEALQECYNGPQDGGGCPFKHFDLTHLQELLQHNGILVNKNQILLSAKIEHYSQACSLYLQDKLEQAIKTDASLLDDRLNSDMYERQSGCTCAQHGGCCDTFVGVSDSNQSSCLYKCGYNIKGCVDKCSVLEENSSMNCQYKQHESQTVGTMKNSCVHVKAESAFASSTCDPYNRNDTRKVSMDGNCGESVESCCDICNSKLSKDNVPNDPRNKHACINTGNQLSCPDVSSLSSNSGKHSVRFRNPVEYFAAYRQSPLH